MFASEQKVGLFVLATLVLLGLGTFLVGDLNFLGNRESVAYTAQLSDVQGLNEKADVRVAGVDVGKVSAIHLRGGKAQVKLRIRPDVRLPESTRATVSGSGLVGEKYVTLAYDADDGPALAPGATIPEGGQARSMDDLMRTFGAVGEDLRGLTSSLNKVFGSEDGQQKLARTLDNVDRLAASLRKMAKENRQGLKKIVANLQEVTGEIRQDLPAMVTEMRDAASGANTVIRENRADLRKMMAGLSDTADNLAKVTGDIRKGEGTIGKLYKEEKLYEDVASVSANLKKITSRIEKGEGALGKLVSDDEVGRDLEKTMSGLGEYSGRMQRIQTAVSLDTRYMTEQEASKSSFNVRLQTRPTRYYQLGLTSDGLATQANDGSPGDPLFGQEDEFGEEYKFTFMFGKDWPSYRLSGRVGLFQSAGGLGLSYYPYPSLELSADAWDFGGGNAGRGFDGPQSRLMAQYAFFDDHLMVEGGVHNAFSSEYRSPFVGVGLRFFDQDLKYLAGSVPTGGL